MIWKSWQTFWFEADARRQLRLFRPVLAILLFIFELSRAPDLRIFYSNSGIMPSSALEMIPGWETRFSLLSFFPDSMVWITGLHLLLLASLLCLAIGFIPRISAIIAFILHVSFMNRNMAVLYGVDTISTFFLFYLCFADFRSTRPAQPDLRSMLGSTAFRLSQIQICIIYGYSGLDKVRGVTWWSGEALWYVVSNKQFSHLNFSWISHFPVLIVFLTYSTLFWEVYFPALVWFKRVRYPVLAFGVMLHLGIAVVLGLKSFCILMISLYLLFLEDVDADKITQCVKKYVPHRKVFLQ